MLDVTRTAFRFIAGIVLALGIGGTSAAQWLNPAQGQAQPQTAQTQKQDYPVAPTDCLKGRVQWHRDVSPYFRARWPVSNERRSEKIQIAFDREKQAITKIYLDEVNKPGNPCLYGRVTFALAIRQDGKMADAVVEQSDLGSPELEERLRQFIMGIDFGAVEKPGTQVLLYPFHLQPP